MSTTSDAILPRKLLCLCNLCQAIIPTGTVGWTKVWVYHPEETPTMPNEFQQRTICATCMGQYQHAVLDCTLDGEWVIREETPEENRQRLARSVQNAGVTDLDRELADAGLQPTAEEAR